MQACRAGRIGAAARDRRGIASIEFGAIMFVIIVIVLGTYDVGHYVLQQLMLADAARVGGLYAVSYPLDTAGMVSAVTADLPAGWTAPSTPVMTCMCANGGGETDADCNANPVCPIGQTTERFYTITVTQSFLPLLVTSLPLSTSASYVARVQ
jgi:Flp pilus assembly protein TadG